MIWLSHGPAPLREYNLNHEPGGSAQGGQFAASAGSASDGPLGRVLDERDLPGNVRQALEKAAALSFAHPFTEKYGPRETFFLANGPIAGPEELRKSVAGMAGGNYVKAVRYGSSEPGPFAPPPSEAADRFIDDVTKAGGLPGTQDAVQLDLLKDQTNLVSVHTHPTPGMPFSVDDLNMALKTHSDMYVVASDGTWFRLHVNHDIGPEQRADMVAFFGFGLHHAAQEDTPRVKALLAHLPPADFQDKLDLVYHMPLSNPLKQHYVEISASTQMKAWSRFIPRVQKHLTFSYGKYHDWPPS